MPHIKPKRSVKILNAVAGEWTNRNRAARYVRDGRAVWVGADTIRLLPEHQGHQAAGRNYEQEMGYARAVHGGPIATVRELCNIPVVCPMRLLGG